MPRTPNVTYRIMSAVKSKNTKPELLLGKAMWGLGLRYRKHYPIIGKPDFVFLRARLVVFCDGDFWHGNNWKIRGLSTFEQELALYTDYWRNKIINNVNRDKLVQKRLEEDGWRVYRFWESEINAFPLRCAKKVQERLALLLDMHG